MEDIQREAHVKRSRLGSIFVPPLVSLVCVAGAASAEATASTGAPSPVTAPNRGVANATDSPLNADGDSALRLTTAKEVEAYFEGKKAGFDPMFRVVADGASFEIRSKRSGYGKPLVTTVRHGDQEVTLPAGSIEKFGALPRFIRLDYSKRGEKVATTYQAACLNGWTTERIRPDAPLRSPYPQDCTASRITLGTVMGVQEGYATQLESWSTAKLKPGRYQVTAQIRGKYRSLFGITDDAGSSTFKLRVVNGDPETGEDVEHHSRTATPSLRAAAREPSRRAAGEPAGPMPDLRSIPAFGLRLNASTKFLQFSGTVWNAGNSPLVVDGFRRPKEDVMDAYQYFLDADGNQVGYQQVGTMEWDNKDTHQHWHFRDFARYRLLDADKKAIVRSRKEAFCLANTDAIDYTVDGADWQPEATDLHTACGDKDSLSIREVLASGSGDTYAQFRAGQSFKISDLPNGIYYISVEANPVNRLVESDTSNNIAYRKIKISGKPTARTVKAYPFTAK
ncbi:hypothetical protein ASG90_11920 [Nocardioides sp. Soil797]|nr:hypothetical protein ASG90_11920 [Nocardioides sp. Soil797]